MDTLNGVLFKSWRISKKNPSHALCTAALLLVMATLASILFVLMFNYHDDYESLVILLRKPVLAIIGAYIIAASLSALLFLYRYFELRRRYNAYSKVSDK